MKILEIIAMFITSINLFAGAAYSFLGIVTTKTTVLFVGLGLVLIGTYFMSEVMKDAA